MGFHTDASVLPRPRGEEEAGRLIEIQRDIERLRRELDYYKALVNTVLLPLIPQLEDFANRLLSATSNWPEGMP
ncbi:hypothetical protein O9K51_10706 [Purpureocillium lavendulum]|uniref:Uncharacterized protein n=1 Tax=Purpureocillium lavendulum TaxID=1247861 RepID=A0AB34FDZ6_9HYPO|nr:hypothetical protein O9K51_10706 [Purpureocillium lavendulum]